MTEARIPNKKFAAIDKAFINACEKVGITATPRQASKWRNGKGKAYKEGK